MKSQQSRDCNSSRHIEKTSSVLKKDVDKRVQQALQNIDEDASLSIPKKIKLCDIKSYFAKKQLISKSRPQRLCSNSFQGTGPRNGIIKRDIPNNSDTSVRPASPLKQQPLVSKISIIVHKDPPAIAAPVVPLEVTANLDMSSKEKHERIGTRYMNNCFGKGQQDSEIDSMLEKTKSRSEKKRESNLLDGKDRNEGAELVKGKSALDLFSGSNTKTETSTNENIRGKAKTRTMKSGDSHFEPDYTEDAERFIDSHDNTENDSDASKIFDRSSGFEIGVVTERHSHKRLKRNSESRENNKEKAQSDFVHAISVDTSDDDESKHGNTSDSDNDAKRFGVTDSKPQNPSETKQRDFNSKGCKLVTDKVIAKAESSTLERVATLDKAVSTNTITMFYEKQDENTYRKTSRYEKGDLRENSDSRNKESTTSIVPLKSTTQEDYEEQKRQNNPLQQQLNKMRSCDECRRRKVRCDAIMNESSSSLVPTCLFCLKSNSTCSFEKESHKKKSQTENSRTENSPRRKIPTPMAGKNINSSIERITSKSYCRTTKGISKTTKLNFGISRNALNNEVLHNRIPLISPSGRMILDSNNLLHPSKLKLEATMQTKTLFPFLKDSILQQMNGSVVPFLNKFSKISDHNPLCHINDKIDNDIYGFNEGSAMFDSSISAFASDKDDFIQAEKKRTLLDQEDQPFSAQKTSQTSLFSTKTPNQYTLSEVSSIQNEEVKAVMKPITLRTRIELSHRNTTELNTEEHIVTKSRNDSSKLQEADLDQEILDVESDDSSDDSDTSDIVMISDEETFKYLREGTPYKRG